MARLKRPATAGPASPKKKVMRHDDSSDSDEEVEQLPRRSARLAAKNGEASAAPTANPAPARAASKKTTMGTSNPVQQPRIGPLSGRPLTMAAPPRAVPVANQPRPAANQPRPAANRPLPAFIHPRPAVMQLSLRNAPDAVIAMRRERQERERREEEEKRAANQELFDDEVTDFYTRWDEVTGADMGTLRLARERLRMANQLHSDMTRLMLNTPPAVDRSTAMLLLDDVTSMKDQLHRVVGMMMRADYARRRAEAEERRRAEEEEEERRRFQEEFEEIGRRAERGEAVVKMEEEEEEGERRRAEMRGGVGQRVVKTEEEEEMKREEAARKKKEEEEEERRRMEETQERLRREASIIDKECTICFDEITDARACIFCKKTVGCKSCMLTWMKNDRSCPLCRHKLKNMKEVVKIEDLNKPPVPLRRSTRGRASGAPTP